jgi:hypothetical protein
MSAWTPLLISEHIFYRTKLDTKGSHFMVPFGAAFKELFTPLRFLALIFLVAVILATTSADT